MSTSSDIFESSGINQIEEAHPFAVTFEVVDFPAIEFDEAFTTQFAKDYPFVWKPEHKDQHGHKTAAYYRDAIAWSAAQVAWDEQQEYWQRTTVMEHNDHAENSAL